MKIYGKFYKILIFTIEHNAKFEKGEVTWSMGLNHMTDWTPEERSRLCGSRPMNPTTH